MMGVIKQYFLVAFSLISVIVTSLTFVHCTRFLSEFSSSNSSVTSHLPKEPDKSAVSYTTKAVLVDISLLSLFIIVHSSLIPFQDLISAAFQLSVLSRPILNLLTSASLQLLMHLWLPIPQYVLWVVDTERESRKLAVFEVHIISWILIYGMMLMMDITEILGIKQVYYYTTGRPAPNTLKSQNLRSFHLKMRHPSFLCLSLILWTYPFMRLDRLLLAVIWSIYMLLAWRPDSLIYNYLVLQASKKSVI